MKIEEILQKETKDFLDNINKQAQHNHSNLFESGFGRFSILNDQYYEQLFFESYLEHYIRNYINSILDDIFFEEDFLLKNVAKSVSGWYIGYTNQEFENKYLYEFIDEENWRAIKYCYIKDDEKDKFLNGDIDELVIVDWQHESPCISYADTRITVLSVNDFFELYEIGEYYAITMNEIGKAIEQAKKIVSISTIPSFSPKYLFDNRIQIELDLTKSFKSLDHLYVDNKKYRFLKNVSRKIVGLIKNDFLNEKQYKVLLGKSDFSISYLTSEYLFSHFKSNGIMDYTPIASGYIKSIEQLLYFIISQYCTQNGINISKLKLDSLWEEINFIMNNKSILKDEYEMHHLDDIKKMFDNYRVETRNCIFHRDNLEQWNNIIKVRNNTLIMYMLILSIFNLTNINNEDFGIIDDEFDRFYKMVSRRNINECKMEFSDGKIRDVYIPDNYIPLAYNQFGVLEKCSLLVRDKGVSLFFEDTDEVEINSDYMPVCIWENGKKITWDLEDFDDVWFYHRGLKNF